MLHGNNSIIQNTTKSASYKYRNFDSYSLKKLAPIIAKQFHLIKNNYESQYLSPAEAVSLYLFILLIWKNPSRWLVGSSHPQRCSLNFNASGNNLSINEAIHLLCDEGALSHESLNLFRKGIAKINNLSELNFMNFINRSAFLGVPESAIKSLLKWGLKEYPLVLLDFVPTPIQLFKLQSEGQRCVTLLFKEEEVADFIENGRDILGFVLHDLIHADHFYRDPLLAKSQIGFSKFIYKVYSENVFSEFLKDPQFEKDFYYIVSDMNSHPTHLLQTLKAQQLFSYKRLLNLSTLDRLTYDQEIYFENLFSRQFVSWELSLEESLSLCKINHSNFTDKDSEILEKMFIKLTE